MFYVIRIVKIRAVPGTRRPFPRKPRACSSAKTGSVIRREPIARIDHFQETKPNQDRAAAAFANAIFLGCDDYRDNEPSLVVRKQQRLRSS